MGSSPSFGVDDISVDELSYHKNWRLQHRSLTMLLEYSCHRKVKAALAKRARGHLIKHVLGKIFPWWLAKAQEQKHQRTILQLWSTATPEEAELLPLEASLSRQIGQRSQRACWEVWRVRFLFLIKLKKVYHAQLFGRVLSVWQDWASLRQTEERKSNSLLESRRTKMAFKLWCERLHSETRDRAPVQGNSTGGHATSFPLLARMDHCEQTAETQQEGAGGPSQLAVRQDSLPHLATTHSHHAHHPQRSPHSPHAQEEERLYARYWRAWRLAWVRRQAANKDAALHRRQVLSQAFTSWRSLCPSHVTLDQQQSTVTGRRTPRSVSSETGRDSPTTSRSMLPVPVSSARRSASD